MMKCMHRDKKTNDRCPENALSGSSYCGRHKPGTSGWETTPVSTPVVTYTTILGPADLDPQGFVDKLKRNKKK